MFNQLGEDINGLLLLSPKSYYELSSKTMLGYRQYQCHECKIQYNASTGTALNYIEYPTEVVMIAVHYYFRFKVSLDDVVELMATRGFFLSHQTVHKWTQTVGTPLGLKLRTQRYKSSGKNSM